MGSSRVTETGSRNERLDNFARDCVSETSSSTSHLWDSSAQRTIMSLTQRQRPAVKSTPLGRNQLHEHRNRCNSPASFREQQSPASFICVVIAASRLSTRHASTESVISNKNRFRSTSLRFARRPFSKAVRRGQKYNDLMAFSRCCWLKLWRSGLIG